MHVDFPISSWVKEPNFTDLQPSSRFDVNMVINSTTFVEDGLRIFTNRVLL